MTMSGWIQHVITNHPTQLEHHENHGFQPLTLPRELLSSASFWGFAPDPTRGAMAAPPAPPGQSGRFWQKSQCVLLTVWQKQLMTY
jgi:hypothetical protein